MRRPLRILSGTAWMLLSLMACSSTTLPPQPTPSPAGVTITVRVKAHARKNEVRELGAGTFEVSVTAPPVDGKANERVIELLAAHFGKPKRDIVLVRGASSKQKIFRVD